MKLRHLSLLVYSKVPNNRPSPPPIVNFSTFFHPGHLYSNPPPAPAPLPLLFIFSHFCSHFWVWIAIFTIDRHKEKEIGQSSTITMNCVNTKHMLSLWAHSESIFVIVDNYFSTPSNPPPPLLLIIITMSNPPYSSNPSDYSGQVLAAFIRFIY